jgi:hypothetical protein
VIYEKGEYSSDEESSKHDDYIALVLLGTHEIILIMEMILLYVIMNIEAWMGVKSSFLPGYWNIQCCTGDVSWYWWTLVQYK